MKTAEKSAIVIFEVTDEQKTIKAGIDYLPEDSYVKMFIDFVESLGFDIKRPYDFSKDVTINGYGHFEVDATNSSYSSKNGWTRERSIRKPQNRFIKLIRKYSDGESVIKIHFNKEYDANKLRAKIKSAIEAEETKNKGFEDRKKQDENNTVYIAVNYIHSIVGLCESLTIHEGILKFYNSFGCLEMDTDTEFINFNLYAIEVKTIPDLSSVIGSLKTCEDKITDLVYRIRLANDLSDELKEWAKTAYNRHFDYKTMEYSKY